MNADLGQSVSGAPPAQPAQPARGALVPARPFQLVIAGRPEPLARWRSALARGAEDARLALSFVAIADLERDAAALADLAHRHDGVAVALGAGIAGPSLGALARRLDRPLIALADRANPDDARAAFAAGAADYVARDGDLPAALLVAGARLAGFDALRGRGEAEARATLEQVRDQLASARAASVTDWLTGLGNRRHLDERLEEEENKATRAARPLSLVLLDLDNFKSVNDRYGHLCGDVVLKRIAGLVRASLRNYDVPCRYGGEEIALILPSTATERALHVAERLRERIEKERFEERDDVFSVTASFGVATLPAPGVSTARELLAAADRCLYLAKTGGRNRVVRDSLELPSERGSRAAYEAASDRIDRLLGSIRSLTTDAARAHIHSVRALGRLIEADLHHAFGRADAVAELAATIAAALGMEEKAAATVRRAALFQDLGMVALGGAVERPGQLSEDERGLVVQHPAISVQIAEEIGFLDDELPLILHHHERLDGSGYPRGLSGARIPFGARVLAVATAYEAMTSARPYREARTGEQALAELVRLAGVWYDPAVVEAASEALSAAIPS